MAALANLCRARPTPSSENPPPARQARPPAHRADRRAGRPYSTAAPRESARIPGKLSAEDPAAPKAHARACPVPHAGFIYSGGGAGAVFARMTLPKQVLVLGVRPSPMGEDLAVLSEGA